MLKPDPPPWRSIAMTSFDVSSCGQRAIDLLKSTQKVPADRTRADRLEALLLKRPMIGLDRLERGQGAVRHGAHEADDVERRFGQIDLAPEQRDPRAVLFRLTNELETVARGARAAAEDADDHARVERRQLFQRSRPVIGDLEKFRPLRLGEAGETADDRVVDELGDRFRAQTPVDVRIEDL